MTIKVTMPQMGESIFEGTITKWLKKVGDRVVRDEPLFEISTDKVDSEIPSPASGVLSQILVPEGKTVQINTVLAIINGAGAEEKDESMFHSGDVAAQEIPEEEPPAKPEPVPEAEEPPPPREAPKPSEVATGIQAQDIRTSPLVRRLAREHNIDLSRIQGTGLEGRITKEDVLNYLERIEAPPRAEERVAPTPPSAPAPPQPEPVTFAGESEVVPMTPMRKAIAEHMVASKRTSAHVHTIFEIDMTPIVNLRQKHKSDFERREGVPLTYSPFFAKALVDNVREFPVFNASVSGDEIVYKKPVNLGIAVALDTGLIVPVIKNAHLKSLTGLAVAMYDLAERARSKRLKPDDVQNGTISMTNPGSFGALFGTPIISQPQVAILGVGGIEKRPVVINDAIAIRSMVYLSLAFDHRVIDGAVADQFMARLKERLQSWTSWID
ncbi:MAG: 2-oxoglutarate dehydrogenase, E2 component, dihydrolipoamide succinyltransferase [Acidobacteria bacterium]|nr:2-oxoglutarate dehydrogenase, E2 component, dihydrolipoamide succinyltransferase [Acidobacteriota bacterium]